MDASFAAVAAAAAAGSKRSSRPRKECREALGGSQTIRPRSFRASLGWGCAGGAAQPPAPSKEGAVLLVRSETGLRGLRLVSPSGGGGSHKWMWCHAFQHTSSVIASGEKGRAQDAGRRTQVCGLHVADPFRERH